MDKLVIEGGRRLCGEVNIGGAKNAALPILFAAILCEGEARLGNVPELKDIATALRLLTRLGVEVVMEEGHVALRPGRLESEAPYELVKTMRASALCLGPLLARVGKARVALPGGCAIGARPIDQHLKAFERMGATFRLEEGYVVGSCPRLRGARVTFDMPTVGGTENVLMAAALASGETVLENAAREPEIVDLANFLNAMGARIEGQGESVIRVRGVESLGGGSYAIMSDRIEAGTFLVAAGVTGGDLTLRNFPRGCLDAVALKLNRMGMEIEVNPDGSVRARAAGRLRGEDVTTQPYPGFPTDMQAQIMAALCLAEGAARVEESIFENRFMHVQELVRMGADIRVSGRVALIKGVKSLSGAPVMASDLRAGAALVLAALAAEGVTEISRVYHIDRGYDALEKKLVAVGALARRERESA